MNPWPFLRSMVEVEEVESTNDLARSLLKEGPVETPFAIRAERQTKGRGRGSNRWWSGQGSLIITLVLEPDSHRLTPSHEARLALIGALALIEAMSEYEPAGRLGFRWPNDVEIGSKKLAGFLTERVETSTGRFVVLGMGVNVTTPMDQAPEAVRAMATSLAEVARGQEPPEIDILLRSFLPRFARHLADLADDRPALVDLWNAYDLLRDRPVRIEQGDRVVEGIGAGIDALGGLILDTEAGRNTLYGGSVVRA